MSESIKRNYKIASKTPLDTPRHRCQKVSLKVRCPNTKGRCETHETKQRTLQPHAPPPPPQQTKQQKQHTQPSTMNQVLDIHHPIDLPLSCHRHRSDTGKLLDAASGRCRFSIDRIIICRCNVNHERVLA